MSLMFSFFAVYRFRVRLSYLTFLKKKKTDRERVHERHLRGAETALLHRGRARRATKSALFGWETKTCYFVPSFYLFCFVWFLIASLRSCLIRYTSRVPCTVHCYFTRLSAPLWSCCADLGNPEPVTWYHQPIGKTRNNQIDQSIGCPECVLSPHTTAHTLPTHVYHRLRYDYDGKHCSLLVPDWRVDPYKLYRKKISEKKTFEEDRKREHITQPLRT